jgi:hypothetical protein
MAQTYDLHLLMEERHLTPSKAIPTFNQAMSKRLISLALVLVIAGSVYAGMPLHSKENSCSMPEMAGMDCCKKAAQAESVTSEGLVARLCCALNCSQEGTSGPQGAQLPRPSVQVPVLHSLSVQPPLVSTLLSLSFNWSHGPPVYSNPAYIRHLSLLI